MIYSNLSVLEVLEVNGISVRIATQQDKPFLEIKYGDHMMLSAPEDRYGSLQTTIESMLSTQLFKGYHLVVSPPCYRSEHFSLFKQTEGLVGSQREKLRECLELAREAAEMRRNSTSLKDGGSFTSVDGDYWIISEEEKKKKSQIAYLKVKHPGGVVTEERRGTVFYREASLIAAANIAELVDTLLLICGEPVAMAEEKTVTEEQVVQESRSFRTSNGAAGFIYVDDNRWLTTQVTNKELKEALVSHDARQDSVLTEAMEVAYAGLSAAQKSELLELFPRDELPIHTYVSETRKRLKAKGLNPDHAFAFIIHSRRVEVGREGDTLNWIKSQ